MKKMTYIIIGVVVVIVLIGGYLFFIKNSDKHVYLKHYTDKSWNLFGTDSNLIIDCQQDSDCKLVNLQTVCPKPEAININNNNDAINKFNNKELKLTKNVEIECEPIKIEDYQAVCKSNLCEAVKRGEKESKDFYDYGEIVSFTKDEKIKYPDFSITYLGSFDSSMNGISVKGDKFKIQPISTNNDLTPQILETQWTSAGPTFPEPFLVEQKEFQLKFGSENREALLNLATHEYEENSLSPGQLIISEIEGELQGKISASKEIKVSFGKIQFIAPNSSTQPSLVIAKEGDKIIWQVGSNTPEIDPNLEKDVQLLDHFVTKMRIDKFESKDALFVTRGDGMKAITSVHNPENGESLYTYIISPPPIEESRFEKIMEGIKSLF